MVLLWKLLRVPHWVKNLFIFLPLFFSGKLFGNVQSFLMVCIAFFAFSSVASAIYILNDIKDVEEDRLHPQKRNRPFAAGLISTQKGYAVAVILLIIAIGLSYWVNERFSLTLSIYFVINLAYSLGLKKVAIVDIVIIALGFLLRVLAGGFAADVFISHWILIMTFLLALFLALAKRRDDLLIFMKSGKKMRASIEGYNLDFVNVVLSILAGIIFITYLMYTLSDDVVTRMHSPYLFITSFFVLIGLLRYLQLTFVMQKSGNPTEILLKDKAIQIIVLSWIMVFYFIIYAH